MKQVINSYSFMFHIKLRRIVDLPTESVNLRGVALTSS